MVFQSNRLIELKVQPGYSAGAFNNRFLAIPSSIGEEKWKNHWRAHNFRFHDPVFIEKLLHIRVQMLVFSAKLLMY